VYVIQYGQESLPVGMQVYWKFKRLGASNRANEIIPFLRNEYPKRKILMEELNNA
jgi:hypothetical protein